MDTVTRVLGLLSLGFGASLGCAGSTSEGSQGGPVPESDLPARYAQTICPNMAECCKSHDFAYDDQICRSSIEAQARALLLSQQSLATAYDAEAMGRCLGAYATVLSACGSADPKLTDVCKSVFVGTLPEGAACKKSSECIDPPNGSASCQNGVCAKDTFVNPVHAGSGQACAGTCTGSEGGGYSCSGFASPSGTASSSDPARCFTNDGLRCDPTTKRCVPAPKLGEPCDPNDGCAPGAYCQNAACVAQKTSGPCPDRRMCSSVSYCDFTRSECLPRKADGAVCSSGDECTIAHCENGKCGPNIPVSSAMCAGLLN